MFYIYKYVYYYAGTFNVPTSGPIVDLDENRMKFKSIEDAKQWLKNEGVTDQLSKQTFQNEGRYTLFYGEYSRPKYQIRKVRS
tara:strand:- start:3746 stop:3994 length:249 start_codon:yes stop_codon:yes gene_type:complete